MSVTLHTDVGDIKVELFCEQCPKACENFLALCASDYYNGCLFHRNIKVKILALNNPKSIIKSVQLNKAGVDRFSIKFSIKM